MNFRHALVIGKFYPPHAGHDYLIRTAATFARQVTVVVMATDSETIPLQIRVNCLRDAFADQSHVTISGVVDNLPVDYGDDDVWATQVALMRDGIDFADRFETREAVAVDAVFTSENYGAELARRFSAVPVCLDLDRGLYAVSGTAVRRDPIGHWDMLVPSVRSYLARRIVVLGAESTGTTTLARDLQAAYCQKGGIWSRTQQVPEYGREYSVNLFAIIRGMSQASQAPAPGLDDIPWHSEQFLHVALTQTKREDAAARSGSPLLICDTDALATCLWHERYVGTTNAELQSYADSLPPRSLYLLTDIDGVPFEQDGLRDGEHIRHAMHQRFVDVLSAQSVPWALISGSPQHRLATAMTLIDDLLNTGWSFQSRTENR